VLGLTVAQGRYEPPWRIRVWAALLLLLPGPRPLPWFEGGFVPIAKHRGGGENRLGDMNSRGAR
jgi:hypothetical protein